MFRDAVEYPTKVEDEVRTYGIAALLTLGSLLVIPAFFLLGYFVKVIEQSLEGYEQIPKFEDFTKLFFDGLKFTGILFAYFFIPAFFVSVIESSGLQSAANLVALPLILLAFYLLPSAIVNFAREDRMISAFNLKEVSERSFRMKYLKGYLLLAFAFLLITLAQILITIVLIITIIGIPTLIVAWPVMRFYENLVYFRIIAKMAE
jgi:hypothetical protein